MIVIVVIIVDTCGSAVVVHDGGGTTTRIKEAGLRVAKGNRHIILFVNNTESLSQQNRQRGGGSVMPEFRRHYE